MAGLLQPLYPECFAGPPWNESSEVVRAFPLRLARHLCSREVFGHVVHCGDSLAGVVYGWRAPGELAAANVHDQALTTSVAPEVAANLVAPALTVAELMVAAGHRRGLASTLLSRFVAGASRAWLVTHPDAEAVALYEAAGWQRQVRYRVDDTPRVLYLWRGGGSPGPSR